MIDPFYMDTEDFDNHIKKIQDDFIIRCSAEENIKLCEYMLERFKTEYDMEI
jgi:hypothetical protein